MYSAWWQASQALAAQVNEVSKERQKEKAQTQSETTGILQGLTQLIYDAICWTFLVSVKVNICCMVLSAKTKIKVVTQLATH